MNHRCVKFTVMGLLLGFAFVAWAQDGSVAASPDPYVPMIESLAKLGLPGVLAYFGYVMGKGLPVIKIEVTIDSEMKKAILEKLEHE